MRSREEILKAIEDHDRAANQFRARRRTEHMRDDGSLNTEMIINLCEQEFRQELVASALRWVLGDDA
jgi:hypothetical protein